MPKKHKEYKPIKWTPLQIQIAKLLKQNMNYDNIAKQVGCYKSLITKVKNAMSLTFPVPDEVLNAPLSPYPLGQNGSAAQNTVLEQFANQAEDSAPGQVESNIGQDEDGQEGEEKEVEQTGETGQVGTAEPPVVAPEKVAKTKSQFVKKQPDAGITAQMQFIPVTATVGMTPIILFARQYLTTNWGWRNDMPWENFFDTIISNYLEEHGVRMGWFEVDGNGNPVEVQQAQSESVPEEIEGLDTKTIAFGKLLVSEMVKAFKGGNGHAS